MSERKCLYREKCRFFNRVVLPDFAKDILVRKYCHGEFENCERKLRKDRGEAVPDSLVPDGRVVAFVEG